MRILVTSVTSLLAVSIILGWYFYDISLLFIIIPITLYISVSIVGSSFIGLNYYMFSYCRAHTNEKIVAITFDDGPHPEITPRIKDVLKEKNVKAAFFWKGKNIEKYPKITKEIFNENHIIGNHTYYHSNLFDLSSSSRMIHEIDFTNNIIYKITGKYPVLFRPPFGVTNPMLKKALKNTGMISIGWSLRSFDTVKNKEKVLRKLVRKTKPGDIILFHDNISKTVDIIDEYITWLISNDYKVVSLDKLLKIKAYES